MVCRHGKGSSCVRTYIGPANGGDMCCRFLVRMDVAAEASCASSTCKNRQEGRVFLRADDPHRRLLRVLHLLQTSSDAACNSLYFTRKKDVLANIRCGLPSYQSVGDHCNSERNRRVMQSAWAKELKPHNVGTPNRRQLSVSCSCCLCP